MRPSGPATKESNAKKSNAKKPNTKKPNTKKPNTKESKAKESNAKKPKAKESNAKDLNAEELNAKDLNAEELNAKELKAKELNAKESNAKKSAPAKRDYGVEARLNSVPSNPILRWLFRGPADDPKMLRPYHPLVACVLTYFVMWIIIPTAEKWIVTNPWLTPITLGACPSKFFGGQAGDLASCIQMGHWKYGGAFNNEHQGQEQRTHIAMSLISYFLLILAGRIYALGARNIYEGLWGCNLGLLYLAYSLHYNYPLIAAASVFALSIDQVLWYIDVLGFIIKRKWIIGVAAYLQWESTHWFKKVTSTHHLWFVPLACWALYHWRPSTGHVFPLQAILLGLVIEFLFASTARLFTPPFALWPSYDKSDKHLHYTYLNINLCYAGWKDVKLLPGVFSPNWIPGSRWYKYIPYQNAVWAVTNFILCLPFFIFL